MGDEIEEGTADQHVPASGWRRDEPRAFETAGVLAGEN